MRRSLLSAALAVAVTACTAASAFAASVTIHVGSYNGRYFLAPAGGSLTGPYIGDVTLDLAPNQYFIDTGAGIGSSAFAFDVDATGNVANVSPEAAAVGGAGSLTFNTVSISINAGGYTGRYLLSIYGTATTLHGNQSVVVLPGLTYTLDNGAEFTSSDFAFSVDATGNVGTTSAAATVSGSTLSLVTVPIVVNPQAYTGAYFVSSNEPIASSGTQTFNLMPGLRYAIDNGAHITQSDFAFDVDASGNVMTDAGPATASGNVITLANLFVTVDPGCYTGIYRLAGYGNLQGSVNVVLIPTLIVSLGTSATTVAFTPQAGMTAVSGLSCFTFAVSTSLYAAQIQPPIKSDGSSVFNANRGVVPVKFTLTSNGVATCQLPAATISLVQTSGASPGIANQSDFLQPSDNGNNFRVDTTTCQYIYNLGSSGLGAGTYMVQISINGSVVGHATFGLK